MDDLEKQLEAAAPILRAADAPAQTPPASALQALNRALAQKFQKTTILSEAQMRLFILQVINESPSDGFSIIERLTEKRVALKTAGEGLIYGLLSQLETSGSVHGRWREQAGNMAKIYQVTDKGAKQLRTDLGTAGELPGNAAGSFAR